MSKITISFESHINAAAQLIPAMTKLLAPTPLNITIEDTATPVPIKRAPKKEAPVAVAPAPADDAEKKAQAKREAAKRFAEKKKAEKEAAAATSAEEPVPEKPAKSAKPAKVAETDGEVTLTMVRAAAAKLSKTKLLPVLEELGVTKLSELAAEDYDQALAAFEAADG